MAWTETQRLSKLLYEARDVIDMYLAIIERRLDKPDHYSRRVRDEIDAYRAERGWSPDGFGGEHEGAS